MPPRIDLFFDAISPYTHLSLNLWSRYAKAWPVTLRLRPFFLGGVMTATGNQPPGTLPARGAYLTQDLARSAALYEVPLLAMPTNFFGAPLQRSALKAARLMCAAQLNGLDDAAVLDLALAVSNGLHADTTARNADSELTIDDALLQRACVQVGLEAQLLLQLAQGDAAKQLLRTNTEEAVARGAFGSPTAFVAGEGGQEALFFGSDRMEQIAHHLGLPYYGARPTLTSRL